MAEEVDQHVHTRLGILILLVDIRPLLATLLSAERVTNEKKTHSRHAGHDFLSCVYGHPLSVFYSVLEINYGDLRKVI